MGVSIQKIPCTIWYNSVRRLRRGTGQCLPFPHATHIGAGLNYSLCKLSGQTVCCSQLRGLMAQRVTERRRMACSRLFSYLSHSLFLLSLHLPHADPHKPLSPVCSPHKPPNPSARVTRVSAGHVGKREALQERTFFFSFAREQSPGEDDR